ncbi:unnamed protein product [Brassica rapa]|uniref:Uncharacterized protein n=1 Tax=Brassica campestris TaxID=3711 RepID=A0A8D9G5Y7_BRACM|nr:unnamed protein product [Brassica rapa]
MVNRVGLSGLYTDEEAEHFYEEFYEDVTEFQKYGELINFKFSEPAGCKPYLKWLIPLEGKCICTLQSIGCLPVH